MLNRSSFKSRVGRIYYIWLEGPGEPEVVFLSNSTRSFEDYMGILKEKYPGRLFRNKKSGAVENSVGGYLSGVLKELDLRPHFLTGSTFEKMVWQATQRVPFGDVASYKEIAERAGYPGAWRAAGTALGHNPVMLIVPCHRVIRSNGELGFFGGGEGIKAFLLDLES